MRPLTVNALPGLLCTLAACAQLDAQPTHPPAAVSVQRYAKPATETPEAGYSDQARRLADCLASYPNYDYRTDLYEARPGEPRRCPL
jgi:hypothetical protein